VQSSGSLIELPDAPYNFSETADLQDKIKTILVQGLEKGERRFAEDAVYILRQLDIPPDDLLSLYKDLTKKAKSDTKGLILEKRIALGDASVLDDILDISRDAKYAESVFVNSFEMTKLASPNNVRRFIELLSTQNQTFKEGAILTLAKMKEKSAIPYLIKALDDGNQSIRYRAVIGLAEITDRYQDFAPAIDLFCQNEKQYVQLWKNWWENEGKAEYEKTEK
jgi:HEAT repeat protein